MSRVDQTRSKFESSVLLEDIVNYTEIVVCIIAV